MFKILAIFFLLFLYNCFEKKYTFVRSYGDNY